jgi:hypothetical protein
MSFGNRFDFSRWAADELETWDQETGAPTITHFGNALQVWSHCQQRPTSVAEASLVFNVDPLRIVEAAEAHSYLFLNGPRDDYTRLMIEHDGD